MNMFYNLETSLQTIRISSSGMSDILSPEYSLQRISFFNPFTYLEMPFNTCVQSRSWPDSSCVLVRAAGSGSTLFDYGNMNISEPDK